MGQEYIDGGPRFDVWRDTHFRMTGPAVTPYLSLFADTWRRTGGRRTCSAATSPAPGRRSPGDGVPVQVLHSSVSTRFPTIRDVFVSP